MIVHYTCTHYLHKQIKFNCERQFVGEYLNLSAFKYIDIIEARCYGFQMISSDNEQSRSRLTDGIIAKMYNVSTTKVFVRYKTTIDKQELNPGPAHAVVGQD